MIFWQEPVPSNSKATASHAIAKGLHIPSIKQTSRTKECVRAAGLSPLRTCLVPRPTPEKCGWSHKWVFMNMHECNSATAVGVRLAHESAVLVPRGGAQGALRSGLVARWHVAGAASLAVALGTAEVSRQALHSHSLLVRLAARLRVPVVSRVGERRHLCMIDSQVPNALHHAPSTIKTIVKINIRPCLGESSHAAEGRRVIGAQARAHDLLAGASA